MRGDLMRPAIVAVLAGIVAAASGVRAATSEESCLTGRAKAAANYATCVQNEVGKYYSGVGRPENLGKCSRKYDATWVRLRARALASSASETCDASRFVDNGDGTVTDNLTKLQWEQKTDDSTIHDKDNDYTWSSSATAADGTAFTSLLTTLNGAGFAGQYDWRLPTLADLLSITQQYPTCFPCIDPMFGPPVSGFYWTASTYDPFLGYAWNVHLNGMASGDLETNSYYVRAVRGGF
jgi:hypothetical protein